MLIYHKPMRAPDDAGGGTDVIDELDLQDEPDDEETIDEPVVTAPALDPTAISDEIIAAEYQRRSALYAQQHPTAPVVTPTAEQEAPDPRLQMIVDLSYTEPLKAEELRLEIAQERLEKKLRPEMDQRFAQVSSQFLPIATERAINASGLEPLAQDYLRTIAANGGDIAQLMSNPQTSDLLTRAAKNYASENASKGVRPPTHIGAGSEGGSNTAYEAAAIQRAEQVLGHKPSKEAIAMARKEGAFGGRV
jgi:hypothetical protein